MAAAAIAAGDSREAVSARARLEERGLADELHAEIARQALVLGVEAGAALLDVGAGTGRMAEHVASEAGLEG